MADENILPRDQNHVTSAGFVNSLVAGDVRPGEIIVATGRIKVDASGGGSGTVTDVSVVTANGFAGTVANSTTTPAITLSTTVTGLIKGDGTALSAASSSTDYAAVAFKTIAVSGQSDVVADSPIDTLTLVAGTNVTITTNAGTDAITINSTASGTGDVVGPASATDNAVARFDGTTGKLIQNSAVTIADTSGDITAGKYNGLTVTTSTGTLTIANGKTITHNATTTFAGTDGKTLTISNSGTLGGGDAFVLAIAAGKTLTQSNSLTYTGTDGSTVAFGTGGTVLYSASTIPLTVGSTTIASGTTTKVLFDNAGVLGEYTISGSVNVAMTTSPVFTTPSLGAATATSINGTVITASTAGVLTIASGKTLTVSNSITLAGTDSTVMTFPSTSATIARTDAAQTFTGTQTFSQVITTANAITASANAATVPVTSRHNIVTNNSAATLTITLTTASAVNMQMVVVQILDASAVAQTITWVNTENSTVTAPATSNGSTTLPLTVGFIFNSATTKWRCVASA